MSDGKNKGVQHKTSVGGQALIEGIMMIRQDISQFLPRELMITKPISKYIIFHIRFLSVII